RVLFRSSPTVLPLSFAVTARAPAALLRVPLTRLPLLMGWSSSGAAGDRGGGQGPGRWGEGLRWVAVGHGDLFAPTPALPRGRGGEHREAGDTTCRDSLLSGPRPGRR